jgi:hypothetical protein
LAVLSLVARNYIIIIIIIMSRDNSVVSLKNLTAVETSTIVKLLKPYVPVGTNRTST